jgi:hypothetical protein
MILNNKQIAYLTGKTQDQAKTMILNLIHNDNHQYVKQTRSDIDIVHVDSRYFDDKFKTNVTFFAEDIFKNALNRPAFKRYILSELPIQIMSQKKPPKIIKISPPALRSLMNDDDIKKVKEYWTSRYSHIEMSIWEDKNYSPVFEP